MDQKTKRTVFSSAVLISSFIACLICVIILVNTLGTGADSLPENTAKPENTTPAIIITTPPAGTTPPKATPSATPTQTYQNATYSTAPQTTKTPEVTMSVTTEPPPPTDSYDHAELLSFEVKLVSFTDTAATYDLTMTFNASGKVQLLAINSERKLTGKDINPNFIRNTIAYGANRNMLSTPSSFTTNVATANIPLTVRITTALKPVDYFIIIDTDVENGLMAESIVKKECGDTIPTILGATTPTLDEEGYLTFEVTLSKDAKVFVQLGENSQGTLAEQTTDGKVSFKLEYQDAYAGLPLIAYLEYNGVRGDQVRLPNIPQDLNQNIAP